VNAVLQNEAKKLLFVNDLRFSDCAESQIMKRVEKGVLKP
jgi:hypothetical protein